MDKKEIAIEYNDDSCMTIWVKAVIFSWSFGEHNPLLKACRTCIYDLLVSTQIGFGAEKLKFCTSMHKFLKQYHKQK